MSCRSEDLPASPLARKGGAFSVLFERFLGAMVASWRWLVLGSLALALIGLMVGYVATGYTATATLIRQQQATVPPATVGGTHSGPDGPLAQTWAQVVRSDEVLRRVVNDSGLPISVRHLADHSTVIAVTGTDLLQIRVEDRERERAVLLANLYAAEALRFTATIQSNEVREIAGLADQKLVEIDRALRDANAKEIAFQRSMGTVDFEKESAAMVQRGIEIDQRAEGLRTQVAIIGLQLNNLHKEISRHHPALLAARQELDQALLRYTEDHPKVKKLEATLEALEAQVARRGDEVDPDVALNGTSLAQSLYTKLIELRTEKASLLAQLEELVHARVQVHEQFERLPESRAEYARLAAQIGSLKETRDLFARRQREAQVLEDRTAGQYRVLQSPRAEELSLAPRLLGGVRMGFGSMGVGLGAALLYGLIVGMTRRRIGCEADLRHASALPILATLGDLKQMSADEQADWAFQTLMMLRARLGQPESAGLICGITSSMHGEGRSTWVNLLATAAKRCGYQVLTVAEAPPQEDLPAVEQSAGGPCPEFRPEQLLPALPTAPLALTAAPADSRLEIPFSSWVWNPENREQWQLALRKWRSLPNTVVLLDLPPASSAEAVLLSEGFPSLVWLCGKNMADIPQTRNQLQTLRHAGSRVVGAVLNGPPVPSRKGGIAQAASFGLSLILALCCHISSAQETAPRPAPPEGSQTNAPGGFSRSSPVDLADWQKRLTLGAGDVLNISMSEQSDSERRGLIIGPDGRLNYLQARDVMAAGLTVDELRGQLESVLTKFYRPPLRVILIPQVYTSKKYYLLGNVVQKGIFSLDRPTTILEAIAQAQGFVTTVERKNTLMLADLPRAFLVRHEGEEAKRVKVDFEALFLHGDLRQNIPLAPGDYLYFPPLDQQEVYCLGEVLHPGNALFSPELTVVRLLSLRGGFTERSYRERVLVVRGSLNHPQTIVVNVADILKAKSADLRLEAHDIVYVSRKPWYKPQELLETAIIAFARAAIITWTGEKVGLR